MELALDRKGGLYEKNKEKITNDKQKYLITPKGRIKVKKKRSMFKKFIDWLENQFLKLGGYK